MKAAQYNFKITQGNSGVEQNEAGIVFILKPGGVPEDLTGAEVVFSTAEYLGQSLRKTNADGGVLLDQLGGSVTVPISVADSRVFPAGASVPYAIEVRRGASQRNRLAGVLVILAGVGND